MRTIARLLLAAILIVPFHPHSFAVSDQRPDLDSEEYTVYSFMIKDSEFLEVIKDHTVTNRSSPFSMDDDLERVRKQVPEISKETLADFKAKNAKDYALSPKLKPQGKYVFISDEEMSHIFSGDNLDKSWKSFKKRYPRSRGYGGFSRVGFNPDKSEALLFSEISCGSLCGSGSYVYLVRKNAEWTIVKQIQVWIS